jgi:hypothetical protein
MVVYKNEIVIKINNIKVGFVFEEKKKFFYAFGNHDSDFLLMAECKNLKTGIKKIKNAFKI